MKFRALAAIGILALGSSLASAASVSLGTVQDLINAGANGITVGDKQFYNFSYLGAGVTADQINVVQAPGSDIGIEFQFNWVSTNGNNLDSDIRFSVHVLDPLKSITGVGLHFDGTATNNNGLLTNATVTEAITDLQGNALGNLSVFNAGPNFPSVNHNDAFLDLTPTRDLMMSKDIIAHSFGFETADLAPAAVVPTSTISLVDNTFRQTGGPTSVPLPPAAWTSLSMIALGALAPLRRKVRAALGA